MAGVKRNKKMSEERGWGGGWYRWRGGFEVTEAGQTILAQLMVAEAEAATLRRERDTLKPRAEVCTPPRRFGGEAEWEGGWLVVEGLHMFVCGVRLYGIRVRFRIILGLG